MTLTDTFNKDQRLFLIGIVICAVLAVEILVQYHLNYEKSLEITESYTNTFNQ